MDMRIYSCSVCEADVRAQSFVALANYKQFILLCVWASARGSGDLMKTILWKRIEMGLLLIRLLGSEMKIESERLSVCHS